MTVGDLIRFTRSFYPDWRPDIEQRLLKNYQLPLQRKVKALSKGMRTKLALLLALSRRPALLILDEPTEGLDPVSIEELLQTLTGTTADGTAVFFSSHQLSEVERIADSILLIDRGRLALDISLDRLRESYRRITVGFDTSPPDTAFRIPGVERVHTSGRQVTVLASHNSGEIVEVARSLAAVSVEVEPVSLREVFLDTVQADAGLDRQ
jgi:ABC-2 type transport system ATP-binding protein